MKIAFTSDLHLKSSLLKQPTEKAGDAIKAGMQNPERYNALINILDQINYLGINTLVIAGDLFDAESQDYYVFDRLCSLEKYRGIDFYIIPGNHDAAISGKYFTSANIEVFENPEMRAFNEGKIKFFFVPYKHGISIGQAMAEFEARFNGQPDIFSGNWVLIGHGDYLSGSRDTNTYEKGTYMPLSSNDIEHYRPAIVILGHIHKKTRSGKVYYPGSPCGMDINETGKRSFLVMDLNDLNITEKTVDTDIIFINESIVIAPSEDEKSYIKDKINKSLKKMDISREEISKVRIRLKFSGYTYDKKRLEKIIRESLEGFSFYDDSGPDLSSVFLFNDPEKMSIVKRVKDKLDWLESDVFENSFSEKEKNSVLEQAMHIILKE